MNAQIPRRALTATRAAAGNVCPRPRPGWWPGVPVPGSMGAAMGHLPSCREQADLSQHERGLLNALPGAAHEISFTVLACELQAGHSGRHVAVGQMYGARARWLRWVVAERHDWLDIADNEHCAAAGPPVSGIPGDVEPCVLPAAHPGGHSFQIAHPPAGR